MVCTRKRGRRGQSVFSSVGVECVSFERGPRQLAKRRSVRERSLKKSAGKPYGRLWDLASAYQRTVGAECSLAFCVGAEVGALVTSRACVALVWLALRRIFAEEALERSFAGGASPLSSWPLPDDFAGGMVVSCDFARMNLLVLRRRSSDGAASPAKRALQKMFVEAGRRGGELGPRRDGPVVIKHLAGRVLRPLCRCPDGSSYYKREEEVLAVCGCCIKLKAIGPIQK